MNETYSIGNGQTEQLDLHEKALTLNCMHDQQAILIGGVIPMDETQIIENHPQASRVKLKEDNVFQALSSRMGTGGVIAR